MNQTYKEDNSARPTVLVVVLWENSKQYQEYSDVTAEQRSEKPNREPCY